MKQYKLVDKILKNSKESTWDLAKLEWKFVDLYRQDNQCVCGKSIVECCVIQNIHTKTKLVVGNECIKKFLNQDYSKVFQSLKKILKDKWDSISEPALYHFYKMNIINDWEYEFYHSVMKKKRGLTSKQILAKQRVNEKILLSTSKDIK